MLWRRIGAGAGAKAHEWGPIRPGTDAALALAMIQVLLNEEGLYDKEFLRKYTNGPYLIAADGHYLRDEKSGKPLMWDAESARARPFDDALFGEIALEGRFAVNGTEHPTAFTLFKEHVRQYTPEKMAPVTTIAAATIRRLAKEFGAAAQIGPVMVLLSNVTEPVCARARPFKLAPVVRVMLVSARIFPTNVVVVPSVAELPTCQNTLQF